MSKIEFFLAKRMKHLKKDEFCFRQIRRENRKFLTSIWAYGQRFGNDRYQSFVQPLSREYVFSNSNVFSRLGAACNMKLMQSEKCACAFSQVAIGQPFLQELNIFSEPRDGTGDSSYSSGLRVTYYVTQTFSMVLESYRRGLTYFLS